MYKKKIRLEERNLDTDEQNIDTNEKNIDTNEQSVDNAKDERIVSRGGGHSAKLGCPGLPRDWY